MQIVEPEKKECKLIAIKKQKKDLHLNTFLSFELQMSLWFFSKVRGRKTRTKAVTETQPC
jgi:hypothetical protein